MDVLLPVQFGNVEFGPWCGGVDPLIADLFDGVDAVTSPAPFHQTLVHDFNKEVSDENLVYVKYVTSGLAVKDRLELIGYTYEASVRVFEIARERMIENSGAIWEEACQWAAREPMEDWLASVTNYIEVLRHDLTPKTWIQGLSEIHRHGWNATGYYWRLANLSPMLRAMLYADSGINFDFGFPRVSDRRHVFRLAAEAFSPTELMQYDLTDFGRIPKARASETLRYESRSTPLRLTILTEGSTDARIIERTLALFYPHLVNRVSVMDFNRFRVPGGAGSLLNTVKAFAGAMIENRIVALFDNDTAGRVAVRSLSRVTLPENIVVKCYPDLPFATEYPTLNSSGISKMNINGVAGAIELYLGLDALIDPSGKLTPVELLGMDQGLGQPQGRLLRKQDILETFERKLTLSEKNPEQIHNFDWTGIRSILSSVLDAFHACDSSALVDHEKSRDVE